MAENGEGERQVEEQAADDQKHHRAQREDEVLADDRSRAPCKAMGGGEAVHVFRQQRDLGGLQGDFGTLSLGRQYTPYFLALSQVADPFASGLSGAAQNLMLAPFMQSTAAPGTSVVARPNQGIRMDNTVKYTSPIFSGISGEIAYGFGEVAGSNADGRVVGGSVSYKADPLAIKDIAVVETVKDGKVIYNATTMAQRWAPRRLHIPDVKPKE